MDVLYDIENGIYSGSASGVDSGAVATEICINVLTFLLSISIGVYVWRNRDLLLHPSNLSPGVYEHESAP